MAGITPVFILLDEASICAFLDLVFDPVDLHLWGGVRTQSHHRPFKLWLEFEVHPDQLFARQWWSNAQKDSWYFRMSLLIRDSRFMLCRFSGKSSSGWRLLFPFSCFFIRPITSGSNSSFQSGRPCWT